ncbi:hypothetical protein [Enterococcus sp. DIV0756]|uniref:hypothetical protein n=1 Tax=Enterococcus sp. DIV0756 TaxID=2774636 RepID=UPI003F2237B8
MIAFFAQLNQMLTQYPLLVRGIVWFLLLGLLLVIVLLLFSLVFSPLMLLYNKLTDKNKSNVIAEVDYLFGQLTEKITGDSIGEVMVIESGDARTSYPAKLYRPEDVAAKVSLPVGAQVLIIDFDPAGVALVTKNQTTE